jgi:hypothetical protein
MSIAGLPSLISIALIGIFVAACNEEPQRSEAQPQSEETAPRETDEGAVVDPAAPRMLEPTKPGGSGTSKG